MATTSGSITVTPTMPPFVTARAAQLGLGWSEYIGILLSNYLNGPTILLPPVERSRRLKMARIQVTLPSQLRRAGQQAAARWKLSFSQLLQSLILHDAGRAEDSLTIHPVRGKRRPKSP